MKLSSKVSWLFVLWACIKPLGAAHLQCAGYEMPLREEDEKWFGASMKDICERRLEKDADCW